MDIDGWWNWYNGSLGSELTDRTKPLVWTWLDLLSMRLPYVQRQLTAYKTTPGFSHSKGNSNERERERERQPHPLPSKIGWMRNRGQPRPDPILLYRSCNLFSNRLSLAGAANLVASHRRNHNNNKKWWMKEMVRKMRGKGKLSNLHTIYINSCVRVWL